MVVIALIGAYLIGSLPFGFFFSKLFLRKDIRNYGSGNIGATNVLRVVGWKAALPVLLLDILKGVIAVSLVRLIINQPEVYIAAGFLAMIGHSFPIFLKFKGGKAAATGIGVLLALSLQVTLVIVVIAGLILAITRYVSLGSIVGACSVPLLFWVFGYHNAYIIFGLATALLVCVRHHQNIIRLLKGEESKLGHKS